MKIFCSIFFVVVTSMYLNSQCIPGEAKVVLDANSVNAHLSVAGALWQDGVGGYEVPFVDLPFKGPSAIYAGGLWLGGLTAGGDLKVAAQEYSGAGGRDYSPGPLSEQGITTAFDCINWDRFWEVSAAAVSLHVSDFEDGTIDLKQGDIYSWPGRGNPYFFGENGFDLPADSGELAPFIDHNADGIYNPDDGDYPDIKGDKAIWWVINDAGSTHTQSGGQPIGAQINCMAYGYSSDIDAFDQATYYVFSIYNKGPEDILDTYAGLWIDFDLGCFTDDRVAYDTTRNMVLVYNDDAVDGEVQGCPGGASTYSEEPPVVGVRLIEDSNKVGVSSLGIINYRLIGASPATATPQTSMEYYNYLMGKWRDGRPYTLAPDGYTGTDETKYLGTEEYGELPGGLPTCNEHPAGDQRAIMSTSAGTLQSGGAPLVLKYAVVFSREQDYPCPLWTSIQEVSDVVAEENIVATSVTSELVAAVAAYPNPVTDQLVVTWQEDPSVWPTRFTIVNSVGAVVSSQVASRSAQQAIDTAGLLQGFYILQIADSRGGVSTLRFVKS